MKPKMTKALTKLGVDARARVFAEALSRADVAEAENLIATCPETTRAAFAAAALSDARSPLLWLAPIVMRLAALAPITVSQARSNGAIEAMIKNMTREQREARLTELRARPPLVQVIEVAQ